MKNQNTIAKEACKKGIISGGALAGFAALFTMYVSSNREVPVTGVSASGDALPGCLAVGFIIMIIGICVMVKNKSRLNQIEREEQEGRRNAGNAGCAYYYCDRCGKRLRITGGKGRVQITCPVCGNHFIVNR